MSPGGASQTLPSRTERTIVLARLALAASSLFAVWIDPSEPERYVVPTYTLHSVYLVYAILLTAIGWNRMVSQRWLLASHLGDIAVCALFQFLSLGPSSSPFFTYFVFSLFCAALRWGWHGTLRTAGLVVALFLLMGVVVGTTTGSAFDLNRYLTRAFYLAVIAGLLMYLGRHEDRLRRDIARLASWPSVTGDSDEVLRRVFEHACGIVGAGRAIISWERDDEPWTHVASWAAGRVTLIRYGPGECDVEAPAEAPPDTSVSAPFSTDHISGRAFFSDLSPTTELVLLTDVVAREIGGSLEQLSVSEQLREVALAGQRLQVARDLHDGVLQSITGIRLEIQDIASGLKVSAAESRDRLHGIERALAMEQRELRLFIESLKPRAEAKSEYGLISSLDALRERVSLEWKVPLTIRVTPQASAIPEPIERAVPPMVHEAVVNALKHGAPSRIWVDVEVRQGFLHIIVGDDGHGFPFRGRYEHAALEMASIGPASLRDRTASLGGQLTIESEETGSRIEIALPLTAGAV